MNNSLQKKNNRLVALDIAKTLSILGVVILHLLYTPARDYIIPWMGYKEVLCFLMVNGFTYCLSLSAHKTDTIGKYFAWHLPRHLRSILWTFLVAFVVETYYHSILLLRLEPKWVWNEPPADGGDAFRYYFRIREMLATLKDGGIGPGAYYIPLLVILAVAFPFFYYAYRKQPILAIAAWLLIDHFGVPYVSENTIDRLGYAFMGVLLYDLYQWGRKGHQVLWPVISAAIFAFGILSRFEQLHMPEQEAATVFGFLGLLLWACQKLPPENKLLALPCSLFGLIGGATYHIFLAQKVYCATRLPAYLVYFHDFNDYKQVGMAVVLGIAFWIVDSNVTKRLFPLLDALTAKLFGRKNKEKS